LRGKLWSGSSISIQWKIPNGKVLAHLGIKSKVLHRALNDISAWVGYCISSPQQSIKCQLWYFNLFFQLISRNLNSEGKQSFNCLFCRIYTHNTCFLN
jgi:hypothetical protein